MPGLERIVRVAGPLLHDLAKTGIEAGANAAADAIKRRAADPLGNHASSAGPQRTPFQPGRATAAGLNQLTTANLPRHTHSFGRARSPEKLRRQSAPPPHTESRQPPQDGSDGGSDPTEHDETNAWDELRSVAFGESAVGEAPEAGSDISGPAHHVANGKLQKDFDEILRAAAPDLAPHEREAVVSQLLHKSNEAVQIRAPKPSGFETAISDFGKKITALQQEQVLSDAYAAFKKYQSIIDLMHKAKKSTYESIGKL